MSSAEELYPPVPSSLGRMTPRALLQYVGPGFIIASVTIGSGELVLASRSGAVFGYSMLWVFLVAGFFKAIQVYSAGRYLALTGEHPMTSWSRMPGPRYWFPLLIAIPTLAVMPIAFSAISEILGSYLHDLSGGGDGEPVGAFGYKELWENNWATAILSGCFVLALVSTLNTLEKISAIVLAILVCCVLIAVVVSQPDLLGVLEGLLVPRVGEFEPWVIESSSEFVGRSPWLEVALYLGAVGGGTYDYVGYIGLMRDKKWGLSAAGATSRETIAEAIGQPGEAGESQLARARLWTRAPLIDTTLSFTAVVVVTLMFAVLGSALLHEGQVIIKDGDLLSQQESFLTVLHPSLKWIYRTGVFLAFVGTLYGAFAIYQQTMAESVRALRSKELSARARRRFRWAMMAYCYLGGLLLMWLPKSIVGGVVDRMTFGAVIGGAMFCGFWCLAMLWTDRVRLPKPLRMRWPLWLATLLGGIVMTGLGVWTLIVYFSPAVK